MIIRNIIPSSLKGELAREQTHHATAKSPLGDLGVKITDDR